MSDSASSSPLQSGDGWELAPPLLQKIAPVLQKIAPVLQTSEVCKAAGGPFLPRLSSPCLAKGQSCWCGPGGDGVGGTGSCAHNLSASQPTAVSSHSLAGGANLETLCIFPKPEG